MPTVMLLISFKGSDHCNACTCWADFINSEYCDDCRMLVLFKLRSFIVKTVPPVMTVMKNVYGDALD